MSGASVGVGVGVVVGGKGEEGMEEGRVAMEGETRAGSGAGQGEGEVVVPLPPPPLVDVSGPAEKRGVEVVGGGGGGSGGGWRAEAKRGLVVMAGEFLGTVVFLFFGFAGMQVASGFSSGLVEATGTTKDAATASLGLQNLLFVSLSFGLSLTVSIWVFTPLSPGLFNPVVSTHPPSINQSS
jgi:hypothetical protein